MLLRVLHPPNTACTTHIQKTLIQWICILDYGSECVFLLCQCQSCLLCACLRCPQLSFLATLTSVPNKHTHPAEQLLDDWTYHTMQRVDTYTHNLCCSVSRTVPFSVSVYTCVCFWWQNISLSLCWLWNPPLSLHLTSIPPFPCTHLPPTHTQRGAWDHLGWVIALIYSTDSFWRPGAIMLYALGNQHYCSPLCMVTP